MIGNVRVRWRRQIKEEDTPQLNKRYTERKLLCYLADLKMENERDNVLLVFLCLHPSSPFKRVQIQKPKSTTTNNNLIHFKWNKPMS
jgi:hypothetical protein